MKRGASGHSFVVGIDKEAGHSSHSALGNIKHALGEGRVGHCGTLDPFATGVLVALIGPATGLSKFISADRKSYEAEIVFGRSTTTDDIEGSTLEYFDSLPCGYGLSEAQDAMSAFKGDIMQVPPAFSALKLAGKRAYEEARRGNLLKLDARPVHIHDASVIDVYEAEDEGRTVPVWKVLFDVSKGTYIRSLARDIGEAVGGGAYLRSLRRVSSGRTDISRCIPEGSDSQALLDGALDPVELLGFKVCFLDDEDISKVSNGMAMRSGDASFYRYFDPCGHEEDVCTTRMRRMDTGLEDGELVSMVSPSGLKAIYRHDAAKRMLVPERVFQTEVRRGPEDIL